MRCLLIALCLIFTAGPADAAAKIKGNAFIQDDGTLHINRHRIRLYGIYIPQTGRSCKTFLRPVACGSRAKLALELLIDGFVTCEPVARLADRSISAYCRVGRGSVSPGEDLAAYLLKQGWAVAPPGAPYEYVVLDQIARAHHRGLWGFQADSVRLRR